MVSPTFDFTDTIKTSQTLGSVPPKILPTKVWKDMVSKCDLVAALFSHVKIWSYFTSVLVLVYAVDEIDF